MKYSKQDSTDNYKKHTSRNPLQKLFIRRFLKALAKDVKVFHPKTVLDVGCGEGFTLSYLRHEDIGKKLEGIDFSEKAVEIGRRLYPYLDLKKGDIYHLPYKDDSFDMVICTEVLEHLTYPEKALKELARVSRKYCVISVPHEPWFRVGNFLRGKNITRWGNDIEHINHWSKGGIVKLAGKYLRIRTVKTPLPWTLVVGEK